MVVRQNDPLDRFLSRFRLGWWNRVRYRIFLRTLHRRLACVVLRHAWQDRQPVISDGPINLPPDDRDWVLHGFHEQCDRCYQCRDSDYTTDEATAALAESLAESKVEWDEGLKDVFNPPGPFDIVVRGDQ